MARQSTTMFCFPFKFDLPLNSLRETVILPGKQNYSVGVSSGSFIKSRTTHASVCSFSVIPHFAQNVERSVNTLAKDPHGEVDEAQFIDASKLVS